MVSSSASKDNRAKCCDTCGDKGISYALITCSGCEDSHRHLYCMQREHPRAWFCEDCDPQKASPQSSNGLTGSDVSGDIVLQQARVPVKRVPVAAASWSGNCRVYNASEELDAIYKLQAHNPLKVLNKAYEFSKSMPSLLLFELTPRCHIWEDIDQHLSGDERDIGLHFFPVNKERQDSYDQLLVFMDEKDYAMRTRVDDMELFIFSSSVLSRNCQERGGSPFLWGLFKKPPQEEVDMSEDMDIDMIGGVEIPGRQDRVHVSLAPSLKRVKTETQELPPPY